METVILKLKVLVQQVNLAVGVISRSPHGRINVMFGPEAHLAFSGARIHSNNTAEMTAMIEALSFLGLHGPVALDVDRALISTPNMLMGFARVLFKLALMCSWRSHVNNP